MKTGCFAALKENEDFLLPGFWLRVPTLPDYDAHHVTADNAVFQPDQRAPRPLGTGQDKAGPAQNLHSCFHAIRSPASNQVLGIFGFRFL